MLGYCEEHQFPPEYQTDNQVGSFPHALPPRVAIGLKVSIDPTGSGFRLLPLRAIVSHQNIFIIST